MKVSILSGTRTSEAQSQNSEAKRTNSAPRPVITTSVVMLPSYRLAYQHGVFLSVAKLVKVGSVTTHNIEMVFGHNGSKLGHFMQPLGWLAHANGNNARSTDQQRARKTPARGLSRRLGAMAVG